MAIQVLSPETVNRIAAGEVLERPANLVKELIENSLDAGADEIEVQFDQGGREVVVIDNGFGMTAEDLRLCLLPHATSKIGRFEDVYALGTFGFRGEALASIAAVSDVRITTRRRGEASGHRISARHGRISEVEDVAARPGTEVRVSGLFANTPAREKFLKSDSAEHGQIRQVIKALALAHESVEFRVLARGDLLHQWPKGQTLSARAASILNVPALFAGRAAVDGVECEALVTSPENVQNVNRNMWFFVQGRWIQDRSLTAAVMDAYQNLLMHGEYPSVVVRLRLAADEVDVNVHPTKSQVRFRDPRAAFRAVSRTIRQVLEQAPWLESRSASPSAPPRAPGPAETTLSFREPQFERTQYNAKEFSLAALKMAAVGRVDSPVVAPEPARFSWASLQVVGQAHLTYIVAQNDAELYLIDQHAAHERVVFERLMNAYKAGRIEVQNLLLPVIFDLRADEVEALNRQREELAKMGLVIEQTGPESVGVVALPALIKESALPAVIERLGHELATNADSSAFERMIADVFASMACHSVVRAGQAQSPEQMRQLLAQMDEFPLSSFCPHGRPVFVRRSFHDVEREFGRIV